MHRIPSRMMSSSRPVIPASFINGLTELFKKGEYQKIIKKIDSSEFKSTPEALNMKAVSYRAIGEENLELSKFYQLQATQLNPTLGQPVSGPRPEFKPPIVNLDK